MEALWKLRLQSLRDDPEAFGSTFEETSVFGTERMRDHLRQEGGILYLGAFEETLVGIVRLQREEGVKERHKGYIFSMYVLPEKRGHGVGKALMQDLIARTKEMPGLEQLHLSVVSANLAARNLYHSLGFEIYGTEPRALKLGEQYWDEDFMIFDLRE